MSDQADAATSAASRPPTIRDVARVAGVSKSLVSLVFNGGENVSEERRLRVEAAAEQLGYRPNLVAQSLSAGRRDLVAIFVSNLHNPLFAEIVGAAKARLAESGQRTMIVSAQVDDGSGSTVLDRDNLAVLQDLRPSGLITVGTMPGFSELADLTATIPTVVASAIDATDDVIATVRSDDDAGINLVVAHLAGQGLQRIAFIGGAGGTVSASREAAFRAALVRHQLGVGWVERADFTEAGARRAVERMLTENRIPQAIVAVNDLTAVGVITALEAAGVQVPRDCRVTGYDDTSLAAIPRISLTSIDPDNRRIGREAAEALLSGGAGEVLIPPRLVVRASSVAPAHRASADETHRAEVRMEE
ncbi:LacI family transcriptional regulator [Leucobacter luti]|uniref:LacI family DNA-binding transcriptional regulator n=1 Tax=Leucobacter luti TaxID=340320 RepID=UPI0010531142|nr:LacI family DNA-binding transcriptional regulator [Leucobacter luti]MCW2289280.1 DNA-binding LacI/PurR family transcriptional regulator [Leucobacter luti]TCK39843.1 LacI family transcriptional regulator [Leucobacter luti]